MRAGAFEGSEFEDASRSMLKRNGPLKRDCFNGPWLGFVTEVAPGGPRRARLAWARFVYAWKELPQPQLFTALGLSNVNPRRSMPE
jgi:hypothetical protein